METHACSGACQVSTTERLLHPVFLDHCTVTAGLIAFLQHKKSREIEQTHRERERGREREREREEITGYGLQLEEK